MAGRVALVPGRFQILSVIARRRPGDPVIPVLNFIDDVSQK
jgi:hypothetical protein